ncbi:MAG: hypothetical protein K0S79_720 [Nitrospira sp.]|nr:hypothetical protein [Nitrospira sp.]
MGVGFDDGGFVHRLLVWRRGRRGRPGIRNFTYAKGNVCDQFGSCLLVHLGEQGRLEKHELLQPDRVSDNQVEFFEPNLHRPGMGADRFTDNLTPLLLKAHLKEMRLEPQTF